MQFLSEKYLKNQTRMRMPAVCTGKPATSETFSRGAEGGDIEGSGLIIHENEVTEGIEEKRSKKLINLLNNFQTVFFSA